jgi:hypothetical protein
METLINFLTVLAGVTLSLAIGLLLEELIFGKVFCLLFARQAARVKSQQKQ